MSMRSIRVSAEAVRCAWLDSELTLEEAAVRLGMSTHALQDRAALQDLPQRRMGRRARIRPHQQGLFIRMWHAGVSARAIARHFSCSYFAVHGTAGRLGLQMRGAGYRPRLTLAQFFEQELATEMQLAARRDATADRWRG